MKLKASDDAIMGVLGAVCIALMAVVVVVLGMEMDYINTQAPAIILILYLIIEGEEGVRRRSWAVWSIAIVAVTLAIIGLYYFF